MLFHKLRHIKTYQSFGLLEKILCKNFNELGLSDARRTCEYHRHGIFSVRNARALAFYRADNGVYCLVLSYYPRADTLGEPFKLANLAHRELGCGNARPYFNNF